MESEAVLKQEKHDAHMLAFCWTFAIVGLLFTLSLGVKFW
jgi:hypothetical protein